MERVMEQERKQLELLKKMKESKQNQGRKRTRSETLNDIEQERLTLSEHLSSPPVFRWVRATLSLVLCAMFCRSLFVLFLLVIVISVLLRFTDSDYPYGIFKLLL
jgi:hypothetical protein